MTGKQARVAVTGASGFIGARLVAMLEGGASPTPVRVLGRRPVGADPPVDLADPVSVRTALAGCTTLVHCAFDFADMDTNIAIARVLAAECAAAGIRMVHISTAAVYEPFPDGRLDETMYVDHPGSHYKQAKLAIEREVARSVRDAGLAAVILQPTIVYGPDGRAWTDSPIRELLTGTVVLPDGGDGLCDAVYIDDVCQAIIAAAAMPVAAGARVLISGAQPVTWREFYGAYQEMLGLDALEYGPRQAGIPSTELVLPTSAAARLKQAATRLVGSRTMARANLALTYARGLVQHRRHVANGAKLALFQSRCEIDIGTARRLLGYQPGFDLAQGMAATRPYVESRYARLARIRMRCSRRPATTGGKPDAKT